MLLVSAIMLSSASYAWFSMNTDVSVEGIQFEAYSDSLFLEISNNASSGYAAGSITADTPKKAMRPIDYGHIGEELGTPYAIDETRITSGYFVVAKAGETQKYYYEKVLKTTENDTYTGEYDYICVNERLRGGSSVAGYYDGLVATPITSTDYSGDLYKKVYNDYVPYTLQQDETPLGYYTISEGAACTEGTYDSSKVYYSKDENGAFIRVIGLDEGSPLNGYYTIEKSAISVNEGDTFYVESVRSDSDVYPHYYAVKAHKAPAVGEKAPILDGYWYRGYSDNVDLSNPDAQSGRITGVIADGEYDHSTTPYYLYDTFYLRMAQGSANATDLRISEVDILGSDAGTSLTQAIRIIFVATTNADEDAHTVIHYNHRTGVFTNEEGYTDSQLIFENLIGNNGEVVTVEMYVYYDGTDEAVATYNSLDISGHKIDVHFEIDKPYYADNEK